ncbi:senescence-specific cysteine protease SAG39-like [Lotus japonicus]|uniref:senescence-specific cysteine protease SAG39-like n=1 Tax=Lotus japonicus TaxID=34305 RepID=UPI00258808E8|nr:senescence-specific cysteine protease SAG39-like [Lotus japonicus]
MCNDCHIATLSGGMFRFQDASIEVRHERWCAEHSRVYKDEEERLRRLDISKKNVDYIEASNKARKSIEFGLNEFADLTNDEIRAQRNGLKASKVMRSTSFRYENVTVPCCVEWRGEGVVTPVKNQGTCGLVLVVWIVGYVSFTASCFIFCNCSFTLHLFELDRLSLLLVK